MNFIKEKKIPQVVVIILTFLALGYNSFYGVRSLLATYAVEGMFKANDVIAFIVSAVVAGAMYELITALIFRATIRKVGGQRAKDMRYALRFFVIPAEILAGALKTLYFFYPFLFNYGEVLIDFIFLLIFFILYIIFCCKNYCKKEEYATIAMATGSSFLVLFGALAVFSLITGVLL